MILTLLIILLYGGEGKEVYIAAEWWDPNGPKSSGAGVQ